MERYRRAQDDYYAGAKPLVEIDGFKAFSLVSPPLGAPATRRRIRRIIENMVASGQAGAAVAARTPHVATIAVTYNCQCDCEHCSAVAYQEATSRNGGALRFEEIKTAIEQVVELGTTCVILTGGEPLLFPKICDLVRAVDRTQSVCTIFSNGELLTEQSVAALKSAGLYGLYVSLDHADADRHDENRNRPGLFAKAVKGLERCRAAGILTGISTYATHEKIRNGELDAMMDVARELQVLEVFLFDVIPTGRLSGHRECILTDEEADQIIEFRKKYAEKPEYPRIVHQTMFASIAYPCVAEGCPAAMVQLHLRANGDVSPCDFTPYSFGNIRTRPLRDIWESMAANPLYEQPSARCRLSRPDFWVRLDQFSSR
ncbi:MAG: radical SAM protein [Bryobacterales bacterium]|nr:radical SAM protein [Bryobacterales bacterium]